MRHSRLCFVVAALAATLAACEGSPGDSARADAGPSAVDDGGPPVVEMDSGAPPTCSEQQKAYVRDLLPPGEDISVAEAVLAVLAHPGLTAEMPYCSGERP